tara:strand:+ start:109 stop:486 length:378 start_codon:yes stop_codon:yes gene_type:complete
MIIEDIPFFVEFISIIILLTFGYAFTKLWFNHAKDKAKVRRTEQKKTQDNSIENEIDSYLDNASTIATKIQAELDYLKSKGATPEQLKSLESKLELANKVQQYEPIIRIAGKPLVRKILSYVDRL